MLKMAKMPLRADERGEDDPIVIGGGLFGFAGMLLSVPLYALGYAFFEGALVATFLTVVTITILSHFEKEEKLCVRDSV